MSSQWDGKRMGQQISFGMVRESDKKLVFNFPWVDKFEEP